MDPITMALIGSALGAFSGDQKSKENQKYNQMQAELTRYSPWTHQMGQLTPNNDNALNGAMQGGLSGLSLYQNLGKAGMLGGSSAPMQPVQSPNSVYKQL